jgi:glycosyltransferase involved in cell wall biosynthesis
VNPGDEFALAHAIERLLGNEPLRRQLAANARQSFIDRFASCRLVSALAAEYARFGVTPQR